MTYGLFTTSLCFISIQARFGDAQPLAILGKISQDEALAAITLGALPKAVTDGIATLPAAQQFAFRMMLCGTTSFRRSHRMTPVFGGFLGMSRAALDALWQAGARL